MVPPASRQIPRVLRYSGSVHAFDPSLTRLLLSLAELSSSLLLKSTVACAVHNPSEHAPRFGLFPVRSPLLRKSIFLSLPPGTKMFQFPGFASIAYVFSYEYRNVTLGGFPHSDITGSSLACSSPMLFAAYHVLRRLLVPRHPPYALSSLTFSP